MHDDGRTALLHDELPVEEGERDLSPVRAPNNLCAAAPAVRGGSPPWTRPSSQLSAGGGCGRDEQGAG